MKAIKKHFVTGLIILLPLVITIAAVVFLVNFLTEPFIGMVSSLLSGWGFINTGFLFISSDKLLIYGSKAAILILLFLLTLGLGVLARWFFLNMLLQIGDRVLSKIPVVNTVYKTTQDIIKTLFASDKNAFKQVVMVPFPRSNVYVLGLISREAPSECSKRTGEDLTSVFVPTTPNPTTGFLLMFKRSDMVFLDMKPEEALKYIISCGVILPKETPVNPSKAP